MCWSVSQAHDIHQVFDTWTDQWSECLSEWGDGVMWWWCDLPACGAGGLATSGCTSLRCHRCHRCECGGCWLPSDGSPPGWEETQAFGETTQTHSEEKRRDAHYSSQFWKLLCCSTKNNAKAITLFARISQVSLYTTRAEVQKTVDCSEVESFFEPLIFAIESRKSPGYYVTQRGRVLGRKVDLWNSAPT